LLRFNLRGPQQVLPAPFPICGPAGKKGIDEIWLKLPMTAASINGFVEFAPKYS
jgi:hypothetical protein